VRVVAIVAAVLLALLVIRGPWGIALVATAILWELGEKAFFFITTRRIPLAVGPETLVGRSAEVVAACRPNGTVRLWSERWKANCPGGAEVGDIVVVESMAQLTLIVSAIGRAAPRPH
jgi:membrane protein implicated in regulation of membrane protease activity